MGVRIECLLFVHRQARVTVSLELRRGVLRELELLRQLRRRIEIDPDWRIVLCVLKELCSGVLTQSVDVRGAREQPSKILVLEHVCVVSERFHGYGWVGPLSRDESSLGSE